MRHDQENPHFLTFRILFKFTAGKCPNSWLQLRGHIYVRGKKDAEIFYLLYVHCTIYIVNAFLMLIADTHDLKGQCHKIFCFWFFSWICFPPAPEYSIKTISNFFENSRRYSQLKVCHRCQWHRWQMKKIFNQKNFNNFIWSPASSLSGSAAWYCSNYLPPVSLIPAANSPWLANISTNFQTNLKWS